MLAEEGAHHPAYRELRAAATSCVLVQMDVTLNVEEPLRAHARHGNERACLLVANRSRDEETFGDGTRRLKMEGDDSVRRRVAARKKMRTHDGCWDAQHHHSHGILIRLRTSDWL